MAREIATSEVGHGKGGAPWDDSILSYYPTIVGVQQVDIRHGDHIDSVQFTYRLADGNTYTAPTHGGSGGCLSSFTLACDERIDRIEGKTHSFVGQLTFVTKDSSGQERTYGPYGETGNRSFTVEGCIVGFFGRSGTYLDKLGVYFLPTLQESLLFGGSGGLPFADPIIPNIPPVVGVKRIRIRHGDQVDSIDVDYVLLGKGELDGINHGGSGGEPTYITFDEGEFIIKISGTTNGRLVDQLTFTTRKVDGSVHTYGPYGKTGNTPFEIEGNIVGFFGRSGALLDAIGVFYDEP